MNPSNIRNHGLAMQFHGPLQARRGRTGRSQQRFHKPARVGGVEPDEFPAGDDFLGGGARMRDDKSRHRAPFERGGLLKNLFVRARDPCDEPLRFLLDGFDWHGDKVCLCGTQIKN